MAKRKNKKLKTVQPNISYQDQKLVNIVIPVHRRFDLLEKCLNAIPEAAQGISYNVTIFDNGSPREEADAFYNTRKEPNLRIIRNRDNVGFPVACNRGADAGFAPLIFFLNDDVILHPTSLQRLVKQMDDPTVGVASMKLIFPEETDLIQDKVRRPAGKVQHVGLETNIRAEFYHIFLGWQPDHPRVMNTHDVYVVTGAALMTRRKIWKQLHGFNPMYGGGTYEDCEFCLACRKLGYNIVVDPEAVGVHHTGATAEKYGFGYDLIGNRTLFLSRWKNDLDWSEINRL